MTSVRALIAVAFAAVVSATPLAGQTSRARDVEIKATYLFNFGHFVRWPASALDNRATFDVCVFGRDPFGSTLDTTLSGETIDGRVVSPKRVARLEDTARCHILFISASEQSRLAVILAHLERAAVLTTSDIPQFVERGGMIQFVASGGRVRFDVNVTAAERAGLVPSSDLLRVATNVRRNPGS